MTPSQDDLCLCLFSQVRHSHVCRSGCLFLTELFWTPLYWLRYHHLNCSSRTPQDLSFHSLLYSVLNSVQTRVSSLTLPFLHVRNEPAHPWTGDRISFPGCTSDTSWDGLCRYFKASQETTNTSAGSETDCSPTAEWESLGPLSALGMSGYIPGELGLRNTIPASTPLICPHCTFLSWLVLEGVQADLVRFLAAWAQPGY